MYKYDKVSATVSQTFLKQRNSEIIFTYPEQQARNNYSWERNAIAAKLLSACKRYRESSPNNLP
jgi:hypothetical protein